MSASLCQLLWRWIFVIHLSVGRHWRTRWGGVVMSLCLQAWTHSTWGLNRIYVWEDCWQVFRDCKARERSQKTVDGYILFQFVKGGKKSWFCKLEMWILGKLFEGQPTNIKKREVIAGTHKFSLRRGYFRWNSFLFWYGKRLVCYYFIDNAFYSL
jgi:hypothetical protein